MKRIFLSYSRRDASQAKEIYNALKNLPGIYVWFDQEDLLPGTSWRPAIRKAIRESDFFIALLSRNSVSERGFRNSELKQAIEVKNEFPEDQIFLIPVRLDKCHMPHEELAKITYADLFPDWHKGFDRLKKAIGVERPNEINTVATGNRFDKQQNYKKSVIDYEYRIGLADLDIGLTNLRWLAEELNQVQSYFHFTLSELHVHYKAIGDFDGSLNLRLHRLPKEFYRQSVHVNFDRVICLTKYFLAFRKHNSIFYNYLAKTSQYDERFMFISVGGLYNHSKRAGVKYEFAIVFLIASKLADYFMDIDYHKEFLKCPMDFTEDHDTIVPGLQKRKFCKQCNDILLKNPPIHRALVNLLEWGRT